MKRLEELYIKYLSQNSKVSFYNWIDGEFETLNDILVETQCKTQADLRALCKQVAKS